METLGKLENERLEKKIPYAAVPCHFEGASSPWQVVAMPVGPTGGERPQARASRGWPPVKASTNDETTTNERRTRTEVSVAEKLPRDERQDAK